MRTGRYSLGPYWCWTSVWLRARVDTGGVPYLEHLECRLQPIPPGCFTEKLSGRVVRGVPAPRAHVARRPDAAIGYVHVKGLTFYVSASAPERSLPRPRPCRRPRCA